LRTRTAKPAEYSFAAALGKLFDIFKGNVLVLFNETVKLRMQITLNSWTGGLRMERLPAYPAEGSTL